MSYVGNTPTTQAFTPAVDFFSGNGSTTAFTLSRPVASVVQVQAVVENVPQKPGDAFTVSGNTITFTSAPPSGTQNVYVYYTSPITQVIQPSPGTVGTAQMTNSGVTAGTYGSSSAIPAITVDATGRVTAASQTAFSSAYVGARGQIFTANGTFTIPTGVTAVKVTVVAGGGGGGGGNAVSMGAAGGGGASAIKYLTSLTPGNTLSVTVGAAGSAGGAGGSGGTGGTSSVTSGTQTITTITCPGGSGGATNHGGGGGAAAGTGGDYNFPGASMYYNGGGYYYDFPGASALFAAVIGIGGRSGYGNPCGSSAGGAGGPGIVIFEW